MSRTWKAVVAKQWRVVGGGGGTLHLVCVLLLLVPQNYCPANYLQN